MTFPQIRNEFWQSLPADLQAQRRSRRRHNDYCATIRTEFSFFIDNLARDGRITETQAQNITL